MNSWHERSCTACANAFSQPRQLVLGGPPASRRSAAPARPSPRADGHAADRLRLALQRQRLARRRPRLPTRPERSVSAPISTSPGRRGLLQPGRDVDRIAGREPLLRARHHLAGVRRRSAPARRARAARRASRPPPGTRGARRPREPDRHAEDRHHRVADELLDRAAVSFDDPLHPLEVAGQQRAQRLRVVASPSAVEPVRSQKRTVTVLRCSRSAGAGARAPPQLAQRGKPSGVSRPQLAQIGTCRG